VLPLSSRLYIQFLHPSSENARNPSFTFSQGHRFLLSDRLFPIGLSRLALCKTMSVGIGVILEVVDLIFRDQLLLDQLSLTEVFFE
jgi:hypothetical protein